MTLRKALIALAFAAALPGAAHAWWHDDWTQRTKITLNTSSKGVETKEAVQQLAVAVRLHSGNFDFTSAKEDGSDIRVVGADDKTPLSFTVERFDSINELAVLWVQVPSVQPGTDKNVIHVYAGNTKAAVEAKDVNVFDASTVAAFHFQDKGTAGADHQGAIKAESPVTLEPNGLLAGSAKLDGKPIIYALSDRAVLDAGQQVTLSLWVKLDDVSRATVLQWGALQLSVQQGQLLATVGKTEIRGGTLTAARWTHVVLRLGMGVGTLFVGGKQAGQGDLSWPTLDNKLRLGEGALGQLDELQVANTLRSADWVALSAASQGAESLLVASQREGSGDAGGESHGYMGILVKNLTVDAWAVIIILAVMFVVATWVTISKSLLVSRSDKDNQDFLQRFREARHDLLLLSQGASHPNSQLFRLYQAGVRELGKRQVGEEGAAPLSGASLDAVKASVDADFVRENNKLNSQMVLLTIAISGGPFLGLLGTVVGVMITFAAIAAAGDVNVNAIAPGIASALLATVAGLAVAIPALFAYNYLAARIKNVSSDMQIFVDEFITRVAEVHGAR